MEEIVQYNHQTISKEVVELVHAHIKSNDLKQLSRTLMDALTSPNVLLLVIKKDNKAIGFCYGNLSIGLESKGSYFWLNEFFIKASMRHQGYGSKLMQYLKEMLKSKGVNYMALATGKMNKSAQKFFEEQGLQQKEYLWYDIKL